MTKRSSVFLGCMFLLAVFIIPEPSILSVGAQSSVRYWVYSIETSGEAHTILKTYLDTGQVEPVATIPRTGTSNLASVVSLAEMDAARDFFQEYVAAYPSTDVDRFFTQMPVIRISSFSPSPDNQLVALVLQYERCAQGIGQSVCFGASEVRLISGSTGAQTKIWNIDYHSSDYFPEATYRIRGTRIEEIQWVAGQRAVAVGISNALMRRNAGNSSIVVIPFLDEVPAFRIGEGYIWGASRTEHAIATVRRVINGSDLLSIIAFDLLTGETNESTHSLQTHIVDPSLGVSYLEHNPVFEIAFDESLLEGGGGTAYFDSTQTPALVLSDLQIGRLAGMRPAISGAVVIVENEDGFLWKVVFVSGALVGTPITTQAAEGWAPVQDGVAVKQVGATDFQFLQLEPNVHPVADAGIDQQASTSLGGTVDVVLDGTGSSDADGTIAGFHWYQDGILVATGEMPLIQLGVGVHTITLIVVDEDGATSYDSVNVTISASSDRITDGLLALYTFEEGGGGVVHDVSGVGTPLDLTIGNPAAVSWGTDTLTVTSPTLIASPGAATKVISALQASQEITLEAWVAPASATQDGPARIVTLSQDPYHTDMTLGQGHEYTQPANFMVARLRTTTTDLIGRPALWSYPGTLMPSLSQVVYTRDAAGNTRLYVNGVERMAGVAGGDFGNWGTGYRLALANELTENRAWLGDYYLVAIYDRALTPGEIQQNLTAGPAVSLPPTARVTADLQALYTFEEGSGGVVHDVSGVGTPLDLTIDDVGDVTWNEGVLSVTAPTLIASPGAATKINSACQASSEITLEAWLTPANRIQDGPARIMTLSDGAYTNAMLGQGAYQAPPSNFYTIRLRTTATSLGGTPALVSPAGSLSDQIANHVVYTRNAGGTARVYVNGIEQSAMTVGGDFANWNMTYRLALANELTQTRAWLGDLHLVAIYCRALTPAEIEQNLVYGPDDGSAP